MVNLLWIAIGGCGGALARYGLRNLVEGVTSTDFPFGTLVVNVLGCLLIGVVMALIEHHGTFSPEARLLLLTGVLGSFTTFSTFGWETLALARDGNLLWAGTNVAANVFIGLGAVWLGHSAVRLTAA